MFEKPSDLEIENRFSYHPPKDDSQKERYQLIRKECGKLARIIVANTPASDEQMRSLEHLDLVMMLSNAAIARTEK